MSQVSLAREHAEKLDADDPLAGFRDRFALDDPSLVYLNGNSLGALPRATLRRLEAVVREEWGTALARSWDHWVDLPGRAGDVVGRLTGAAPGQVLVADNTTVNLYKLACAALDARPGRHVIVTDRDTYAYDILAATVRTREGTAPMESEQGNAARIIRDFVDAVREGRPPLASGPSVLPAMRVLQTVQDEWDARFGARSIPGRPLG